MKKLAAAAIVAVFTACAGVTSSVPRASDETAVRDVLNRFVSAWNQHDMDEFAQLFSEDADFVNVVGMRWLGRAAIKDAHVRSHAAQFRNSRLVITDSAVRFLSPDVAVARSTWELNGHLSPDGRAAPTRRGIITNVLKKSEAGWQIVVTQNTDILERPPN